MPLIDREGIFRATITDYCWQDSNSSQAMSICCQCTVSEWWNPTTRDWEDWSMYGFHAYANVWLISKDGNLNQDAQKRFMHSTGWDGSFESIEDRTFLPWPVKITVRAEEYNGETKFKVAWINHVDDEGSALKAADPAKVQSVKSRFAAQMRASASAAQADMPEPPKATTAPASGNGIPF